MAERAHRRVFGSVAAAYDRHRPSYPPALIDDLLALAGRPPSEQSVADIGCGTGKVAELLADRGVVGVGVEPDPEMAAVALAKLEGRGWRFEICDFEDCPLPDASLDLITCGQAWHWIDGERGFATAARLLRPGGWLALFWNRQQFRADALRAELDEVYERLVPGMESTMAGGQFRHKGEPPADPAPGFETGELRTYERVERVTTQHWVDLLGTHSDHIVLDDDLRHRVLGEVAAVIDRHGGSFDLPYTTHVWLGRRAG